MSVSQIDLYRMALKSGMNDAQAVKFASEMSGRCHTHREAESLVSATAKALGLTVAVGVGVGLATAEVADDLLLNIPSSIAGTAIDVVGGVVGGVFDLFDF